MMQRMIIIGLLMCALTLLAVRVGSMLIVRHKQQSIDHPVESNLPMHFKIDLREVLIDGRGGSLETMALQGARKMCVVSANSGTADASKECSKDPGALIFSVCLTGNCKEKGIGVTPAIPISVGGLSTLALICEAVHWRGAVFIDSQGNCRTP